MEIAVSILSIKESKAREKMVAELNNSNCDYIHFDVADGKFVPTKSLCLPELVKLIKLSKKKNDVHLMVDDPIKYIEQIKNLNVDTITIHVEINQALKGIIEYIKKLHIKVGLAVDLNTDISAIKPYEKMIDRVLIMTVKAGKGGQKFEIKALEKLKKINSNLEIEIDGGINDTTVNYVNGVDVIVSGSYVLQDIKKNIDILKREK